MKLNTILEGKARDQVTMTVPLLIKLLEWAREEATGDVDLHELVETLASHPGVLDTSVFDELVGDTSEEQAPRMNESSGKKSHLEYECEHCGKKQPSQTAYCKECKASDTITVDVLDVARPLPPAGKKFFGK